MSGRGATASRIAMRLERRPIEATLIAAVKRCGRSAALLAVALLGANMPIHAETPTVSSVPSPFEAAAAELGATRDRYEVEYLMMPMRDGVRLETTVLRPKAPGRYPVIMVRTPYTARREITRGHVYSTLLARGDYAFVFQNERGSNWSEGRFALLQNVANDGYDTMTWIAAQSWSNGKIGTVGCSSSAENQLRLGTLQHAAHKAMVAMSPGTATRGLPGIPSPGGFHKNGVPLLSIWATWLQISSTYRVRPALPQGLEPDEEVSIIRNYAPAVPLGDEVAKAVAKSILVAPSRDVLTRLGVPANELRHIVDADPGNADDPAWAKLDGLGAADSTGSTPNLLINGWGDLAAYETLRIHEFMQDRPDQYLIMAPTDHCQMWKATEWTKIGERPIGDGRIGPSRTELSKIMLAWFDWRLKGDARAWTPMPKVQTFLMGANTWLTGERWPLKGIKPNRFYISSDGGANSASGDGRLLTRRPTVEVADEFQADPADPVGGGGDGVFGPSSSDQRTIEARKDVLVYTSPALTKGLAVVGDLKAVLYVSADVKDTDVAVKVVDVYPDGTAYNVTHSILRLRYREGLSAPRMLERGQVYRVEIGGMATSNYFAPGHRFRLEISGANFPYFERNMNTGSRNSFEASGVVANIKVHHGAEHASYIEFDEYTHPLRLARRSAAN